MKNYTIQEINDLVPEYLSSRDQKLLGVICMTMYSYLNNFLYRYEQNKDYREEVVSTVIERIIIYIDTFDASKAKFTTWITQIAYNEVMNRLKMRSKYHFTDDMLHLPQDAHYNDFELEDHLTVMIEPTDVRSLILEFKESEYVNSIYVDAMVMSMDSVSLMKYAIDNNLNHTTMKTRAHQGRKFFKEWLKKEKFKGKNIIID